MTTLRVCVVALLCTLFSAAAAAAAQGGGAGAHGGAGSHSSSAAAQAKSSRVTRYDNPRVLHYLEPSLGFESARYEGCGTARAKSGCPPAQSVKLLSLRDQGLRLRQSDGGTLTAEHRAELQFKLESLLASGRKMSGRATTAES
jgi:hypothetical protein